MNLGGTEQHLVRVLSKLALGPASSNNYQVFTLEKKGVLAPELEKMGISVKPLIKDNEFLLFSKLPIFLSRSIAVPLIFTRLVMLFYYAKSSPCILHFYLPAAYVLGGIASIFAGFKQVKIMSRRSLNYYQKKMFGFSCIERNLHKTVNCITANSLAIVKQLKEKEGVPDDKIRLLYNGIDIDPFLNTATRESLRKEFEIDEQEIVLIIVANLIPYKGHADLLNAMAIVGSVVQKKWRLLIVGRDDGAGANLKKQAEMLKILDKILWLGSRQDVPNLLKMADIGLLCSHEEGFSNAILEGMASKLPMVVTDVGGNKEAVITGETGFVVPARDPKALANAIIVLINNNDMAKKLGEQGFLRVKTEFSLDACVKAYQDLYESFNDKLSGKY